MSLAPVMPLWPDRLRFELEAQRERLAPEVPERLVLHCADSGPPDEDALGTALAPAYRIDCPGSWVGEREIRDALDDCVARLGVRELIVVRNTRLRPPAEQEEAGTASRSRRPSLMERVEMARSAARRELASAEAEVRTAVQRLRQGAAPAECDVLGMVYVSESGVIRVYDVDRDVYEPLV